MKVLTGNFIVEAGNGNQIHKGDGSLADITHHEKSPDIDYGAFYFTAGGDFRHFYAGASCMKEFVTILKASDPHYALMRVMEFYKGDEIKRWGSALIEEDKTE